MMMQNALSMLLLQASGQGGLGFLLMPMLFFVGIMYFLLILPQQRKQKRWQQMVSELKAGDKVTTGGGIRGTIIAVKEDALHLRVPPDNLRLEVVKSSIVSVSREEEPK
ncbi:MAG TPA: preprotein translocase subunit YajC [Candidatus Angelobacter sp.]|nr:preprotein translocase subunit YajC [Candidatus Angelobacter sp.]